MNSLLRPLVLGVVIWLGVVSLRAEGEVVKERLSLQVGDKTRYYTLSRPAKFEANTTYPLLIGFHGNRTDVKAWLHEYVRFDKFIPEKKFIVAYPEGPIHWATKAGGHDLAFFDELLVKLKKDLPIDSSRIYLFGHSNGAGFATFLLCARPDVAAAVAAHSGIYAPSYNRFEVPEHKAPLFVLWGEKDEMLPATSAQLQAYIDDFKHVGFPVESVVLPKWGHSWGGEPNQVEEKILAFFFSHRWEKPADAVRPEVKDVPAKSE